MLLANSSSSFLHYYLHHELPLDSELIVIVNMHLCRETDEWNNFYPIRLAVAHIPDDEQTQLYNILSDCLLIFSRSLLQEWSFGWKIPFFGGMIARDWRGRIEGRSAERRQTDDTMKPAESGIVGVGLLSPQNNEYRLIEREFQSNKWIASQQRRSDIERIGTGW